MTLDDVKAKIDGCRDCVYDAAKRTQKDGPYTFLDNRDAKILVIGPIVNMFDSAQVVKAFERFGFAFLGDDWYSNGLYDFTSAIRCSNVRYADAINNCWVHTKNICTVKQYGAYIAIGRFAREQLDANAQYFTIARTISQKPVLFLPVPGDDFSDSNKKGAELVDAVVAEVLDFEQV